METQVDSKSGRDIKVVLDGSPRELTFQQAFALGHEMWRRGKTLESTLLFQRLHRHDDASRPVRLMLARGLARIGKYKECHNLLHETLDDSQSELASRLHDAFVLRSLGDKRDALHDLAEFAKDHAEFSTVCLILGDLWESLGKLRHAQAAWKLAAQRAQGRGPVAYSARHQINAVRQRAFYEGSESGEQLTSEKE